MKFDLTSDVHFDFWVKINDPEYAQEKKFLNLFEKIVPENHSDTLVLAGDIGHYNEQNIFALKLLKKWYKNILLVFGNHDLYLVSKTQMREYNYDSFRRLFEMKRFCDEVEGIHHLNGNTVEIEGKTFGGTGMWYDFQYGVKEFNHTIQYMEELWEHYMSDSRLIKVSDTVHGGLDNFQFFQAQYDLLKQIYKKCDVIISHIGPDWSKIKEQYKEPSTGFYYFDGRNILEGCDNKVWVWGHTHTFYDYFYGTNRLIAHALGYPHEIGCSNGNYDNINYKFKTIEI